jgi:hypothetical protein
LDPKADKNPQEKKAQKQNKKLEKQKKKQTHLRRAATRKHKSALVVLSVMLSIPLKTTNKVDFVQPLQQFIIKSFSKEQLKQHEEALNHLQQSREDVRTMTDKSEHTRDAFLRYYGLLETVEKRFPINEENVRLRSSSSCVLPPHHVPLQVKINFVWFDCLKRKKTGTAISLPSRPLHATRSQASSHSPVQHPLRKGVHALQHRRHQQPDRRSAEQDHRRRSEESVPLLSARRRRIRTGTVTLSPCSHPHPTKAGPSHPVCVHVHS